MIGRRRRWPLFVSLFIGAIVSECVVPSGYSRCYRWVPAADQRTTISWSLTYNGTARLARGALLVYSPGLNSTGWLCQAMFCYFTAGTKTMWVNAEKT